MGSSLTKVWPSKTVALLNYCHATCACRLAAHTDEGATELAVSRFKCRSDLYEMDLLIDINVDVYPVEVRADSPGFLSIAFLTLFIRI